MRVVLFDGNALGEVARFIDIATAQQGNVIGQELQRHDGYHRLQIVGHLRDVNHFVGPGRDRSVSLTRHRDHRTTPGLDLFEIAHHLIEDRSARDQKDRRRVPIHQTRFRQ